MKVVIIGAGPSGLVACKSFLESATLDFPFDPIVFEQESEIGGTFRYRSYENASLVSSKQLTCFSDFRLPLTHPDHLTLEEYVQYLKNYADHFKVSERIKFESRVVNICRDEAGGHIVSFVQKLHGDNSRTTWDKNPKSIRAQYVTICAGLHVTPCIPSVPGLQYVLEPQASELSEYKFAVHTPAPAVFHSVDYKSRTQLAGRRVMILGSGETGMDIAYEAAKAGAKEVVLCSRAGFLSFPKALNDFEILGFKFTSNNPLPIDTLITNLGETAYVHPWVLASHIRWFISDAVIKRVLWLLTGTQAGCNQWVGELEPKRLGRAYVFLNKSHKAMPFINRPYVKRNWYFQYLSRYIDPPEDSPPQTNFTVELAPFPSHFLPCGRAVFPVSKRKDSIRVTNMDIRPDTVIFATGYTQFFPFLDKKSNYPLPGQADLREIVKNGDETIAFIGYVRPGVGAIPPIAEMQSLFWISLIKGRLRKPLPTGHYHLLVKQDARIKYGVDHSTYMSTLAKDIMASPGLLEIWWNYGTHVLACYCFGAAFTPFYRLMGPFRSESAPEIIKTELWETVTRRGLLGNFFMGFVPMVFYLAINAIAFLLGLGWQLVGGSVESS